MGWCVKCDWIIKKLTMILLNMQEFFLMKYAYKFSTQLPPTRLIQPPSLFGKLEYIILVQVSGVISVIKCWLSVWYLITISVTKWGNCGTSEIFNKHWNIKKYPWRRAPHLMTDLETWNVHSKLFCFIAIESPNRHTYYFKDHADGAHNQK